MSLKPALQCLVDGRSLSRFEAAKAMASLIDIETPDAVIASFLSLLRVKGPSPDEVAGFVDTLSSKSVSFPVEKRGLVDTCGTGGDGKRTFNISTAAALIAASGGARVIKHGNRAASGVSGSADLLEKIGIPLDVDTSKAMDLFDRTGFVFLFAPRYHPSLGRLAPIRRSLGFSTVFNILGPLLNPAGVRRQVLGVWHPDLVPLLSQVLLLRGVDHALVIHGEGGYDEATPVGPVRGRRLRGETMTPFELDPEEIGIGRCSPDDLTIQDSADSARILRAIVDGERSPRRDAAVLNAALCLHISLDIELREAKERADDALDSGRTKQLILELSKGSS